MAASIRNKSSDSELVCVELMKSFCLQIVLYGLELTDPKSCYSHICELRCIRPYLDFKTANTIATSIE